MDEKIFRAYDIRGTYPDQVNEDVAYKIASAYAEKIKPETVVVGRDLREASDKMFAAVVKALTDRGVNVQDAGQMTNPMIGFAVFNYGLGGGIILSASHNPVGYGGMKMMREDAVTIAGNDEQLKKFSLDGVGAYDGPKGTVKKVDIFDDYVAFVRSMIDEKKLASKKILLDTTHGSVGLIIDKILKDLPVRADFIHKQPDFKFGGLCEPNPLNPEIQKEALQKAASGDYDFTLMWDGDGDRVFFLDEKGKFINAPYITAALVETVVGKHGQRPVVCDPRIIWPLQNACQKVGVEMVTSKSGYRFMKETMGRVGASFGAEMTAHYFFEETHFMDNGIIPFLLIWELLSKSGKKISELVAPFQKDHFMIDEIKFKIEDPSEIISELKTKYADAKQDDLDGLTIEYPDWRMNFRASNTEPAAKLNLEAKNEKLLKEKTEELKKIIEK